MSLSRLRESSLGATSFGNFGSSGSFTTLKHLEGVMNASEEIPATFSRPWTATKIRGRLKEVPISSSRINIRRAGPIILVVHCA